MEPDVGVNHLGDGPAQAVISANRMARMARRAEQTKEELQRIQSRVDQMIQAFERSSLAQAGQQSSMEVLEDVGQLESILGDRVLRKKYQQQLTVFIVGYQETCGQRRFLLSQLDEFFSFYAKLAEEDTYMITEELHPDIDDVANEVKAALSSSEVAMSRLADLNKQLVNYVNKVRPATANPKSKKPVDDKGRKKLEKAMEQAKEDIMRLTNKLLQAQEDVESKDTRLKELLKQNEAKGLECQHFHTQLESTKKKLQHFQEDYMMQRALLEAEVRRQVASVSQLEEQLRAKEELRRETASQWSDRAPSSIGASEWDIELEKELEAHDADGTESSFTVKLSQVTSELEEEMDPSSLDRAMSRSPPESLLESSVEERTGEQTPPLFVSPAPPPSSPIPEHPQTSQSGEGSQVLEGGSINGESSPTNQSEEQAEHRLQERSPLHDLPAQTQSGGRPGDEAGSSASPGVSQDPQGMPSVTEQQSEPSVPGKESPAPSDVPAVPPMDGSSEMSTELAELKKQHQQTTTRLKTDFQVLAAQWEEERRGLLQQINQAAKDQAISERKAAFALKELQRLNSEHRQTSPAGDVQQSGRSGLSSPFPGKRPSNGRPPRAVSPMSPRQRPGSRMVSETAFDDGIRRLHHGIRTMVESIKKGLLAQGLHSLAQLLDGGWVLEKNGILPALGEDRKAELAKSLEVLQNATEVFHSLLESISYHCGVPLMQEEMTSPRPENEDLESNQDDEERSQTGSLTSEKAIPTGKSSKRSIMAGFPQALRQERDLGNAADTVTHGPEDQSGIIFTHLDDTHNRRVLDRAVSSGRVPGDLYQGAILAMDSYGKVRRERLVTLLSGYLRISSLKGAVKRIKREVQCQPESGKGLRRLQELEKQVLHHWKEVRRQSSESRIRLSASLNETLRNVEEQSGIFLIKPVLSWPGGSSALKSSARINAYVKVVPKNLTSSTHPAAGQEISHLAISAKAAHGIRLSGISLPTNHSAKVGTNTVWSSNPPETGDHGTADVKQVLPSAMVITPKLLEMDVNNYLFDECRVSVISHPLDGSAASISRTPGAALLRNFLPVRRSTPVNQHSPEKR